MSLPLQYPLKLYTGDSHRFVIRWLTGEAPNNLNPVILDPDNGSVIMTITKNITEGPVLTLQGSVENLAEGQIVIPVTVEQSRSLEVSNYRRQTYLYDIQWTQGEGEVTTLLKGTLVAGSDVTIN